MWEKGENAGNQHFLLFTQCFLPVAKHFFFFISSDIYLYFVACKCFHFRSVYKILLFGKEVKVNSNPIQKKLDNNIFSFSHNVFKILFPRGRQKSSLWVKLTPYLICQFLALPIQQQIKDMMSKIRTNGVQLSDSVENIVGREEIARYEQFLLFPQCFQMLSVVDASKWVFME